MDSRASRRVASRSSAECDASLASSTDAAPNEEKKRARNMASAAVAVPVRAARLAWIREPGFGSRGGEGFFRFFRFFLVGIHPFVCDDATRVLDERGTG